MEELHSPLEEYEESDEKADENVGQTKVDGKPLKRKREKKKRQIWPWTDKEVYDVLIREGVIGERPEIRELENDGEFDPLER